MRHTKLLALGALAATGWAIARAARSRFSFAGKCVLITGGSRGLGLVLARKICAEGGSVVLLARDADELKRAKDELSSDGGEVLTIVCDLLDRKQTEAALDQAIKRFGGIDVLINNAGIIEVGPLEHMQREDFERSMDLHFWAPFNLMWKIIPHMRNRGGGRIVNIASIGGKMAVPHLAPYSASKFALVGLSDALRSELARDHIHVTTVAPGLMRTGSHVNAKFKGRHASEFAWFSLASGLPLFSMSAERAAAKIIAACRRGQPSLTLTFGARAAIAGNVLAPNLSGYAMKFANNLLPGVGGPRGHELRSGWESRTRKALPSWLTRLADRATAKNNEMPPRARRVVRKHSGAR